MGNDTATTSRPTTTRSSARRTTGAAAVATALLASGLTLATVTTPASAESSDLALGRPSQASTVQYAGVEAAKASDGSSTTRWSSKYLNNQWWRVDLGAVHAVSRIDINWERAFASKYRVETSTDGATWSTAATVTTASPGWKTTTFTARNARFVRVLGLTRATPYGISFWDARVFGAPSTTTTSPPPATVSAPPTGTTLWTGDHEEGNLSDWSRDGNGGEYNTAPGDTFATSERAHGGSQSAKLVYGGGFSGTRNFRWGETNAHRTVTIEQWMYFPSVPTVSNWWWLQEFKTTRQSDGNNQASWIVDAYNPSPGVLKGRLSWVLNQYDRSTEGPHAGEWGNKSYPASVNFPVGRWFKSTISITQSKDFDGAIKWYIDDQLQVSQTGIRTAWPSTKRGNAWQTDVGYASISYGDGLSPAPYSYYIDDVRISG